ncbi:hypothetical protein PCE1_002142 [Barthelona sp. PCE]
MSDIEIEGTIDSGSLTYPKQATSIRKGEVVLFKDQFPCRIVNTRTSKTGKHGHAKVVMTGLDIFSGNKHELMISGSHDVQAVNVSRRTLVLQEVSEDDGAWFGSLLDPESFEVEEIRIKEELAKELQPAVAEAEESGEKEVQVVVLGAMNMTAIDSFKHVAL